MRKRAWPKATAKSATALLTRPSATPVPEAVPDDVPITCGVHDLTRKDSQACGAVLVPGEVHEVVGREGIPDHRLVVCPLCGEHVREGTYHVLDRTLRDADGSTIPPHNLVCPPREVEVPRDQMGATRELYSADSRVLPPWRHPLNPEGHSSVPVLHLRLSTAQLREMDPSCTVPGDWLAITMSADVVTREPDNVWHPWQHVGSLKLNDETGEAVSSTLAWFTAVDVVQTPSEKALLHKWQTRGRERGFRSEGFEDGRSYTAPESRDVISEAWYAPGLRGDQAFEEGPSDLAGLWIENSSTRIAPDSPRYWDSVERWLKTQLVVPAAVPLPPARAKRPPRKRRMQRRFTSLARLEKEQWEREQRRHKDAPEDVVEALSGAPRQPEPQVYTKGVCCNCGHSRGRMITMSEATYCGHCAVPVLRNVKSPPAWHPAVDSSGSWSKQALALWDELREHVALVISWQLCVADGARTMLPPVNSKLVGAERAISPLSPSARERLTAPPLPSQRVGPRWTLVPNAQAQQALGSSWVGGKLTKCIEYPGGIAVTDRKVKHWLKQHAWPMRVTPRRMSDLTVWKLKARWVGTYEPHRLRVPEAQRIVRGTREDWGPVSLPALSDAQREALQPSTRLIEIAKAEAFVRYRARFGAAFDEALARAEVSK